MNANDIEFVNFSLLRTSPCDLGKVTGHIFFAHFVAPNVGTLYLIKIMCKLIKSFLSSLTEVDNPQDVGMLRVITRPVRPDP